MDGASHIGQGRNMRYVLENPERKETTYKA
jgi:hypothetical protein